MAKIFLSPSQRVALSLNSPKAYSLLEFPGRGNQKYDKAKKYKYSVKKFQWKEEGKGGGIICVLQKQIYVATKNIWQQLKLFRIAPLKIPAIKV